VALDGPRAVQRLVIIGTRADGSRADLTRAARITSLDPGVAAPRSLDGEKRPSIVPAGDGETRIRVEAGGAAVEVPVIVRGFSAGAPPRFTHDIVAGLTRAGCNSGACHGSQHGKGGFKLSLLGYEPDLDHVAITRDSEGRRVVLFDPPRSLVLQKPLLAVKHGGGRRFERGSPLEAAIERWLGSGAPGPAPGEPAVASIDVFPAERVLVPGEETFIAVTAALSDGTAEDVTGKALISSLNDGVAAVDTEGLVAARGPGETSIMVRYQGQASVARITVPHRKLESPMPFAGTGFIDEAVSRKWAKLGLVPAGIAGDAEFIRRLFLVAIGTLPSPKEVEDFLDDASADKRDKLIDRVLDRPEYVDYWALKWGDILRIDRQRMGEKGMWSFLNWVRGALRENRPLDRMVEELITAQGSTFTTGPANYFRTSRNPNELAETTSQVFLGLRLQCAQCHHHPFEKWSQDDYYGLAAYFSRLGVKSSGEFGVYGEENVVYVKADGEVRHPKTGKVLSPKPLDAPAADDPIDRRRALARWLVSRENRLFARNISNRIWGYLMGRGIVEPIDDLRVTNPPTNPDLLDGLADELARSGFDQKHLIRTILRSRVFQLSSRPPPGGEPDETFFSRYLIRRLPAEVLLDAVTTATGVPEGFPGLPGGTRAIQLPDARFDSYFLQSFGKPRREIACECERVSLPNMAQALHLMNGDFIQRRVSDASGRAGRLVKENAPDDAAVKELYLATFSRRPTAEEAARAREAIAAAPSRKEGVEDLLWALTNSSEFLFNH
jgi:hypothetical protein